MSFKRLMVSIAVIALLSTGCQWPFLPPPASSEGISIRLALSQPSLVAPTSSRLLLQTADRVEVSVSFEGVEVARQTLALGGQTSITTVFRLLPKNGYLITAQARGDDGTLRFAGESSFDLIAPTSFTLALFPVFSEASPSGWPVVTALPASQPVSSSVLQALSLAGGESTTFLLDFGTAASAFTFEALTGDLALHVQSASSGASFAVSLSDPTLLSAAVGSPLWITYYAPTVARSLSTLGRFTIPATGFTLSGPSSLSANSVGSVSITTLVPSNSTDLNPSDFNWTSSDPSTLQIDASGTITSNTARGQVTITAASKISGASDTLVIEVNPVQPSGATISLVDQTVVPIGGMTASVYGTIGGDPAVLDHLLPLAVTDTGLAELWYQADGWSNPAHLVAPSDLSEILFDATGLEPGLHTLQVQALFSDGRLAGVMVPFEVLKRGSAEGLFQIGLLPHFLPIVDSADFNDDFSGYWQANVTTEVELGVNVPTLSAEFDPSATLLRATLGGNTVTLLSPTPQQIVTLPTEGMTPGLYVLTLELWGGPSPLQRQSLGSQSIVLYYSTGATE